MLVCQRVKLKTLHPNIPSEAKKLTNPMHIPSDQLLVAQEFLARAKIMKDNGMEETNIVKQLNEELKKCHGDDGDRWFPVHRRRFGWVESTESS